MSMECWSDDFMLLLATRMGVRSRSCSFHDSMARFATSKVRRVWFKAVADNLDPSLIGWQALDKVVS